MSELYNTAACKAARQDCINRKGVCGRDCPHALESRRWTCKIRELPEVAVEIGRLRYLEARNSRKETPKRGRHSYLSVREVFAILDALEGGAKQIDLAEMYGVASSTISFIKRGIGARYSNLRAEWLKRRKQAG